MSEYWYRFEHRWTASRLDIDGEPYGPSRLEVHCYKFRVIKHTPFGVILDTGNHRFVKNEGKKRYACATREEALESFKARKQRQALILGHQLNGAKKALAIAEVVEHIPTDASNQRDIYDEDDLPFDPRSSRSRARYR